MIDDIRNLLDAEPFRPFVLVLTGRDVEYTVDDPRQVTIPIHGEAVHYRNHHRDEFIIATRHITHVRLRRSGSRD